MNVSDFRVLQILNGLAERFPAFGDLVGSFTELSSVLFFVFLAFVFFTPPYRTEENRRTVLIAGLAGCVAIGISMALSELFYRDRPFIALPPEWIHPVVTHVADSSFPSNHAMGSAALAFGMRRVQSTAIRWISMIAAVFVAVSRVVVGVHWPSDVIISFFLGGVVARGVDAISPRLTPLLDFALDAISNAEALVSRFVRLFLGRLKRLRNRALLDDSRDPRDD